MQHWGCSLLKDGQALWTPGETGIQDTKYIVVVGELDTSNVLVTGPYDIVSRTLNSGDARRRRKTLMARILLIDTATKQCSVAVSRRWKGAGLAEGKNRGLRPRGER